MPTISMMPCIKTTLVDDYSGAGGIALVSPKVRIANAIYATGAHVTKLPLSPENALRPCTEDRSICSSRSSAALRSMAYAGSNVPRPTPVSITRQVFRICWDATRLVSITRENSLTCQTV